MSNDKGYRNPDYPYYEPGMILPDDLEPPMTGYNHESLIGIACQGGYIFLSENGVDETLCNETIFSIGASLNASLEKELVEYKLSKYFNKEYTDINERNAVIEQMARDFKLILSKAVANSLKGSSIIDRGRNFYHGLLNSIGMPFEKQILTLCNFPLRNKSSLVFSCRAVN